MLTDLYQFTMAYGYWRSGRHREAAEFELFFREAPFHGEFTVYCGLEESLHYLKDFGFSRSGNPAHREGGFCPPMPSPLTW